MKEEYLKNLSEKEKHIIRDKGTEPPFSGKYNNFFQAGIFLCRACKSPLYESKTKFDSGCGWPSFDDEIIGAIVRYEDLSGGRVRTEICCAKCDGHLGHVFHGEQLTEKNTRHCVNSLSIQFKAYEELEQATFGAGCFSNIENIFKSTQGVYLTSIGYMGRSIKNLTYEDVSKGDTNHVEVVNLFFSPEEIAYSELLQIFLSIHNPTTLNRQGTDVGSQYRSTIFVYSTDQYAIANKILEKEQKKWENSIVIELAKAQKFYKAEDCHKNYINKNNLGNCDI